MFTIENYPFPISVNEAYVPIPTKFGNRARFIQSKKLLAYHSECERFRFFNTANINKIRETVKNWESLEIVAEFFFPKEVVYIKSGELRQFDVENFGKPLFDSISLMLKKDDRCFNKIIMEKKITDKQSHYLKITIKQHVIN